MMRKTCGSLNTVSERELFRSSSLQMLKEICKKTAETIADVLSSQTEITDNIICNPIAYFRTIYHLQSGVLGVVSGFVANTDSLFYKNQQIYSEEEKDALEVFEAWFSTQNFGVINLSDLYELMLLLEFPVRDGEIFSDIGNLNSIGSFYTPHNLADKIVELTLNNYIHRNLGIESLSVLENNGPQIELVTKLLCNCSFADYSCGTGSFLLAILRYCKTHLDACNEVLRKIALNFNAIEADILSLEIAKIEILEVLEDHSLYAALNKKFVHGNPLIAPNNEYPAYDFCHEFYCHNSLAIQSNKIPRCDVIVGNPPWGTVGFDIENYFHLLCPKLNELEDEAELDQAIEQLSETHSELYEWLLTHDESVDLAIEDIYNDDRFESATMGGLHTNVLFTKLCDSLKTEQGSVGLVLKGSTLTDSINSRLWNYLLGKHSVSGRYDFTNCNKIFNIGTTEKFSILILGKNSTEGFTQKDDLINLNEI